MIDFEFLEGARQDLRDRFRRASPFSYVVIDGFCDPVQLRALVGEMPDPRSGEVGLSRDYMFAQNKFEKSDFKSCGGSSERLFEEFTSDRFKEWLSLVVGEEVFVDGGFHGGGYHQGGAGSFLDMHVDFNYHPLQPTWFRNLNILLYLNEGWAESYGGELKLRHASTGQETQIEPVFNRCVIMHTRDYTLHGYDKINFPDGIYRRSVAAYAYSLVDRPGRARSTTWYPEGGGLWKQALGRAWPALVAVKSRLIGSATARNR